MNRYTLFLVLVGLYANITLPNLDIIENENEKNWNKVDRITLSEEVKKVTKDLIINRLFTQPFNDSIVEPKTYPHVLYADWSLIDNNKEFCKRCGVYLKEVSNRLSGAEKQILEGMKEEIVFCIAEFARLKEEREYKRQMWHGFKPGYSEETKKECGQRAYSEVRTIFLQSEGFEDRSYLFNGISYLFDSYSNKTVFDKLEKLLDLRLISIRAREFLRRDAEREGALKANALKK